MSDFDGLTLKQVMDLGNKIGGQQRAKRFLSGELVLIEKSKKPISKEDLSNGGVTYASGINTVAFLADWTLFYKEVFGLTVDLSQIPLPAYRLGFNWGVAVLKGLTKQQVFDKGKELFPSWKYTNQDLDTAVSKDIRTNDETHIIWCRDRREADEEHKNKSANDIKEQGINPMTFHERKLLGLWFYWKTKGHHLDKKRATLCAGSRYSDGGVPGVFWHGSYDRLLVDRYGVGDYDDGFRAREVVS